MFLDQLSSPPEQLQINATIKTRGDHFICSSLQEMSYWALYFCPWPRISPSILWLCALRRCSIWRRYVHDFLSAFLWLFQYTFPDLRLCLMPLRVSASPLPASVHPGELQTIQLLVVRRAVRLHVPGKPVRHDLSLLFPARLVGLPAVCLRLHVREEGKAWAECFYVSCVWMYCMFEGIWKM